MQRDMDKKEEGLQKQLNDEGLLLFDRRQTASTALSVVAAWIPGLGGETAASEARQSRG